ncbi:ribosome maturation factor RimP [bacterium]|nr:ribosome maturation factor RimP [bacterium]
MAETGLNAQGLSLIENLINNELKEEGFDLADLQFKRAKSRFLLRIFMDNKNGVTLNDCERISQKISASLDSVDLIPGPYILEVSSAGLDRPLKKEKDFIRFQGHCIKITFSQGNNKNQTLEGKILTFEKGMLKMEGEKGLEYSIPYHDILKANLIVNF